MINFITRITFQFYNQIRINLLWLSYYLRNYKKISRVREIIDAWNRNIPSFSIKFPLLNTKTFIEHYKYWLHWIRKMDEREKVVFKDYNPILLINQEEWVHLDLSKKEIPLIYYSYYSPDSEWLPIIIFKSIEQLQIYVSIMDATSDKLISYIKTNVKTERLSISKERIMNKNEERLIIIDEKGLRLNSEYVKELNKPEILMAIDRLDNS